MLAKSAWRPIALLFFPVVLIRIVLLPTALFPIPVVVLYSARYPLAALKDAVVLRSSA